MAAPQQPGDAVSRFVVELHGQRFTYRAAGVGPVVVLLHGIAASSKTWNAVIPHLSCKYTLVAPDLLGHGESAKPPGDYSLGAYASLVRDLLSAIGKRSCTILGHSLGGGIALQFAYQFPELSERLVLVSSGGLGRELHPILRAAALPGARMALPWLSVAGARGISAVMTALGPLGFRATVDLAETWRSFVALNDPGARRAFLETVRAVIDIHGQRVSARDKLHLAAELPTMIVWGEQDPLIPVAHAHAAHAAIPGSRLEVFPGVGHYPHLEEPARFASVLMGFLDTTEPAEGSRGRTEASRGRESS